MHKEIEIVLLPEHATDENQQKKAIANALELDEKRISFIRLIRRSIDARSKIAKIRILVEVFWDEGAPSLPHFNINYPNVKDNERAIIVGAGPAGLFAAMKLIEAGIKPVILERGKDVQARRRDLAAINKDHVVNPDSNYCFGEGGAGTYSDGKLYTRSSKRGDIKRILNILVAHGANKDILIEAHPHIGTNKLPKLIAEIRNTILNAGGEIIFNCKVIDLIINNNEIRGVVDSKGNRIEAKALILATGHSARDIFELLNSKNILIEAKPFALGVRVEHPQSLIDSIQYRCEIRSPFLPAASYSQAQQVDDRGVYSFCMCPGGFIVPAATSPGEIVVNGMSPSKRDSKFANSGIVVEVKLKDTEAYKKYGPLSALMFQESIEQKTFKAGGETQTAPAQRMIDFVNGKLSSSLPETSYQPGVKSALLKDILPSFITKGLQEGFKAFNKKMPGYYTNEAILLGVESRTSSPVRIPRSSDTAQHPEIKGLFPCGEGAGFAGGIISAAMDGEFCAEKCVEFLN